LVSDFFEPGLDDVDGQGVADVAGAPILEQLPAAGDRRWRRWRGRAPALAAGHRLVVPSMARW
jgi:hypothetical protein